MKVMIQVTEHGRAARSHLLLTVHTFYIANTLYNDLSTVIWHRLRLPVQQSIPRTNCSIEVRQSFQWYLHVFLKLFELVQRSRSARAEDAVSHLPRFPPVWARIPAIQQIL